MVGCGVFGRNHARVYRQLQQEGLGVGLAGVHDANNDRAQAVAREFSTQAFSSLAELAGHVDAASVAVPTSAHFPVSAQLMQAGIDVLIEKPLAASLQEANEVVAAAERTGRIAQVGHLERFNPAVLAATPLVTRPMFFEVHRLSVFTPRSLDVDVVMDLMIHDLDVVLALVQSSVHAIHAVGLPVISNKVDIANARVEFENGCVANFTASRVSTERVRKLRFFQPHEYISIDYARQDVIKIQVDAAAAAALLRGEAPKSANPAGISISKPEVRQQEPLRAEIEAFLDAVRRRSSPKVTLADGRNALQLALQINAAIGEHHRRAGLGHSKK
ncbi:MAG: Gfo/Idh/MocA family oxidoreductase [Acidobacteria bacterium]|nr:Gfo/Idh/MocA family oxidoreductase [Acidobacteriota bacterium]MBV9146569.1 Gfo/Idh/MocA family oxidoreductase [Acidobacteriota bacterium]MBV9434585.1 Gfo/Idh/MocA family oxidoreductase [Acidobacteriota bacterium]